MHLLFLIRFLNVAWDKKDRTPYRGLAGVFGSYVRHEQRPDSDLDLLIELDRHPKISLIGLVELEDYLSQLLGVKVDLAIKTNLKNISARV